MTGTWYDVRTCMIRQVYRGDVTCVFTLTWLKYTHDMTYVHKWHNLIRCKHLAWREYLHDVICVEKWRVLRAHMTWRTYKNDLTYVHKWRVVCPHDNVDALETHDVHSPTLPYKEKDNVTAVYGDDELPQQLILDELMVDLLIRRFTLYQTLFLIFYSNFVYPSIWK